MKKFFAIIAVAIAAVFSANTVNAQDRTQKNVGEERMENRHELSVGIGENLPMTFIHIFGVSVPELMVEEALGGESEYSNDQFSALLTLEYGYRLAPKDVLSLRASYCFGKADIKNKATGVVEGSREDDYTTLMLGYRRDWVQKQHFTFYSKVDVGAMFIKYEREQNGEKVDASNTSFFYQVNPLGFEVGGKRVVGYLELGLGQTVTEAGLRVRF